MPNPTIIEGLLVLEAEANIAIICARFNSFIVEQLQSGCIEALRRHGVSEEHLTVVRTPGAFEIPLVAQKLAGSGKYDAVIALGCVIRGSTAHFEHICSVCSHGLAAAARETGVPVVFGVLTTNNIEQAIERAGTKAGNKGADAAATAIEMISLMRQL